MSFEDIQRKKHRKGLGGLFSYCEDEKEKRFSVLGLPLWREYVEQDRCIRSVLGIRTGWNPRYDDTNYTPVPHISDEILLRELNAIGAFTYIPNPGNMGDMLIAASTILFFDKYRLPYTLKRDTSRMDVVVYGGGGIWLGMYKKVWKKLLPTFRNAKRVIILPSSFSDCDELLGEMDERFVVFCRELQSYNYLLKSNTKAKIILDHDMAFRAPREILGMQTQPSFRVLNKARKACEALMSMHSKIGHFFRRDVESLHHIDKGIDLSRFINGRMNSSRKHIMFAAQFMLCALDGYDVIITDRLHVGIAAYLMNKEVYLLDNSYKKISSVYHHSLESERVHLVQEVPEIHTCNHTATRNTELLCEYIMAQ